MKNLTTSSKRRRNCIYCLLVTYIGPVPAKSELEQNYIIYHFSSGGICGTVWL